MLFPVGDDDQTVVLVVVVEFDGSYHRATEDRLKAEAVPLSHTTVTKPRDRREARPSLPWPGPARR
ncbi:hypothetical protein AB0D54_38730 [Streptomyces xanthophaeus]|uniref:hypothetical protein n=1 Tax=Streptomyces xanthophaeus TaxID=67385 RepID=UPI0034491BA2